jgi:hypothetical protein
MIDETVEVTFCLCIGGEITLSEQEIDASIDVHRSWLRNRDIYDGAIIVDSLGNPIVRAEDELSAIVKNFCFEAIPDLIGSKNFVMGYHDHHGYLRLDTEASNVVISGDDIPTIRVPYNELLPALYECGKRFINFLIKLKGESSDSSLEDLIQYLKDKGEVARKALENMKEVGNIAIYHE